MLVIDYLKTEGNSLESLSEEHNICVTQYQNKIMFNYGIGCNKEDPITCECRGLILSYPDLNVLSRGFDRFFNYNEGEIPDIFDISRSETYVKEDGSYISVYFDGSDWCVSTRGVIDNQEFYNLFRKTLMASDDESYFNFISQLDKDYTYIFELCTHSTRIVKQYPHNSVFFLAARNKIDPNKWIAPSDDLGIELVQNLISKNLNISIPEVYSFKTIEDILNSIRNLPELDEGYVVWDRVTNYRIKCKNPSYVALHTFNAMGQISSKNIVELIVKDDYKEYLGYFPEDTDKFTPYLRAYELLVEDAIDTYSKYKHIKNQKEFALAIEHIKLNAMLFQLRQGVAAKEAFSRYFLHVQVELLEKYVK